MGINKRDLNQLQVLDRMLVERSPSKVAAQLHVSQPAVSACLRGLRDFFGDALFIKAGRTMIPTAFAQSLTGPVREILLRAEGVTQMRPHRDVATYQRTVRIATSDFIATVLLSKVLRAAAAEAPTCASSWFQSLTADTTIMKISTAAMSMC